jgi:rSAM/selenodomain-associated transferase 1
MSTIARSARDELPAACGMAIMAKASVPGQSKTRLVPPLTPEEAALCNTAFLRDIADSVLAVGGRAAIAGYVAFSPPSAKAFFETTLPAEIGLIDARYSNLGDCLLHTITQLLDLGHVSAVVINGDSPTLPRSFLSEAAAVLAEPGDRAVLGPARDGGYYLLGLKVKHRRLFEDIAWSTDQVARQTLDRAADLDVAVHVLPEWYDVDDLNGLRLLNQELFNRRGFSPDIASNDPRHARALIETLMQRSGLADRLNSEHAFTRAAP